MTRRRGEALKKQVLRCAQDDKIKTLKLIGN